MYYILDKHRRLALNDSGVVSISPLKLNPIWTDCLDQRAWEACPTRAVAQTLVDYFKASDPTSQAEVVPMADGLFVFATDVGERHLVPVDFNGASEEGRTAFANSIPKSANPYPPGDLRHIGWGNGWMAGHLDLASTLTCA